MKRILIALMVASAFCSLALAQQTRTILKDSIGKGSITITTTKPASQSKPITVSSADNDTIVVAEYTDTPDDSTYVYDSSSVDTYQSDFDFLDKLDNSSVTAGITLAAIVLIIIFSFPLFVIFIAFYFRYRSRKARYRLVEQALAAGQPLPEGVFKESLNLDTKEKGIKNMCLGTGLFIFLWALTGSFAMGCIGLLILFTGLGQYLVARSKQSTDERK